MNRKWSHFFRHHFAQDWSTWVFPRSSWWRIKSYPWQWCQIRIKWLHLREIHMHTVATDYFDKYTEYPGICNHKTYLTLSSLSEIYRHDTGIILITGASTGYSWWIYSTVNNVSHPRKRSVQFESHIRRSTKLNQGPFFLEFTYLIMTSSKITYLPIVIDRFSKKVCQNLTSLFMFFQLYFLEFSSPVFVKRSVWRSQVVRWRLLFWSLVGYCFSNSRIASMEGTIVVLLE